MVRKAIKDESDSNASVRDHRMIKVCEELTMPAKASDIDFVILLNPEEEKGTKYRTKIYALYPPK